MILHSLEQEVGETCLPLLALMDLSVCLISGIRSVVVPVVDYYVVYVIVHFPKCL